MSGEGSGRDPAARSRGRALAGDAVEGDARPGRTVEGDARSGRTGARPLHCHPRRGRRPREGDPGVARVALWIPFPSLRSAGDDSGGGRSGEVAGGEDRGGWRRPGRTGARPLHCHPRRGRRPREGDPGVARVGRWIPFPSLRSAGDDRGGWRSAGDDRGGWRRTGRTGARPLHCHPRRGRRPREGEPAVARVALWIPFPSLRSAGDDSGGGRSAGDDRGGWRSVQGRVTPAGEDGRVAPAGEDRGGWRRPGRTGARSLHCHPRRGRRPREGDPGVARVALWIPFPSLRSAGDDREGDARPGMTGEGGARPGMTGEGGAGRGGQERGPFTVIPGEAEGRGKGTRRARPWIPFPLRSPGMTVEGRSVGEDRRAGGGRGRSGCPLDPLPLATLGRGGQGRVALGRGGRGDAGDLGLAAGDDRGGWRSAGRAETGEGDARAGRTGEGGAGGQWR